MWHPRKPSRKALAIQVRQQSFLHPTYAEVGATQGEFPRGFDHDRNEILLGSGAADFSKALEGLRIWRMFPAGWTEIYPPEAPQVRDNVVVLVFNLLGTYWTSAARIVYEVDETATSGVQRRMGFAYGTLPGHVECGEERFTITWRKDDSVWYEIQAFSRPRYWMTRLAKPLARHWQRRFVRESKAAMLAHVQS